MGGGSSLHLQELNVICFPAFAYLLCFPCLQRYQHHSSRCWVRCSESSHSSYHTRSDLPSRECRHPAQLRPSDEERKQRRKKTAPQCIQNREHQHTQIERTDEEIRGKEEETHSTQAQATRATREFERRILVQHSGGKQTLNFTPQIVVPVFFTDGFWAPMLSSIAFLREEKTSVSITRAEMRNTNG
jgi:hypothetical protein